MIDVNVVTTSSLRLIAIELGHIKAGVYVVTTSSLRLIAIVPLISIEFITVFSRFLRMTAFFHEILLFSQKITVQHPQIACWA